MLLVGSQAMRVHYPDWAADRKGNIQDWDFICTKAEFTDLVKKVMLSNKLCSVEFIENKAIAKFLSVDKKMFVIDASLIDVDGPLVESDNEIYKYACNRYNPYHIEINGIVIQIVYVAQPSLIYVMKYSHRFKKDSVHFEKTRNDLKWFEHGYLGNLTSQLSDELKSILALREKLTYTNGLPKLNQDKKSFFTDTVPYQYDHDTIHEAVKHLDKPAYAYYIKDGEQVMCSKEKFDALPEIVKLYGVLEESYVLALERSIIPFSTDPFWAFKLSLQKVCTSITSGWFREFAYHNYDKVIELYHESFVEKFNQALAAGKIKPFN